jgi:hypothetical protein
MNIDINFEDTYELTSLSPTMKKFSFHSPTQQGNRQLIIVEIQQTGNQFIPEFLNLAFGPPNEEGEIDDFASVTHLSHSKAFSTILLCATVYLKINPDAYIGIDGSDFRRAYLYFRTLRRNYDYLQQYLRLFGLKYYARVLRGKNKFDQMSVDPEELTYVSFTIGKAPLTNHKSLYNYFIFYLNL